MWFPPFIQKIIRLPNDPAVPVHVHEAKTGTGPDQAKVLIRSMLVVDPKKRATCKEILKDPWMTVDEPQKKPELEGFQKNMRVYAKRKFRPASWR